jgi:predicted RNase H-like HicB family nuclease/uncharacterized damage-inducible protein DinB
MVLYNLYLESGPMRKKTMVHVLDLLGCIATGPTTEAALERTPHAIREYLRFLQRHGFPIDSEVQIQTRIAEHITEGTWLGNGDPSLAFQPDLKPLTSEDLETYIQRMEWSRADILSLVSHLSEQQLLEKPTSGGRPIKTILEHIFESEYSYMRAFGKLEDVPGLVSLLKQLNGDLLAAMTFVRTCEIARLHTLTPQELSEPILHGKNARMASRIFRRILEHEWEHLVELRERLL